MLYLKDRSDAGKRLCKLLTQYQGKDVIVYGLPRGGVVVAAEIAKFLHAPMDLILAHKIGHPYQPEYAIGAVSESGHEILSSPVLSSVDRDWLDNEKKLQMQEIKRKRELYLNGKKENLSKEKIAIIVDDGIATGLTMRVGIEELKDYHPKKIVVAVPMSPRSTANLIGSMVDDFIALEIPDDDEYLGGVGAYYREFPQTEDDEVVEILADHAQSLIKEKSRDKGADKTVAIERLIHIPHGEMSMEGMLKIPDAAKGIVLFAHGSGSSRFSPRNNFVADFLNKASLGTLLIDLLSPKEDEIYRTRFNIELLSERLMQVVLWLMKEPETRKLSIGLFGSSTGAAAALQVAAMMGEKIKAVVSRGGRPDLAMPYLSEVLAPSLFIVGGNDFGVIELNQEAFACLTCPKKFEVVPNATHLFEEPGCLDAVADLAKKWFVKYALP